MVVNLDCGRAVQAVRCDPVYSHKHPLLQKRPCAHQQSRRSGETLLIGDEIEVEILETGSSHVKLGIRAPKQVVVLRKEIQITDQQGWRIEEKSGAASKFRAADAQESFPDVSDKSAVATGKGFPREHGIFKERIKHVIFN